MPEVIAALLKRGYVLVGIGGGVTSDIQINDTEIHSPLKTKYRELEQQFMIAQLRSDPTKIPQSSHNEMMRMLVESNNSLDARYRALWITSKLNRSEDHLVSELIMTLVGQILMLFRENQMKNASPKTLKDLLKLITLPKDVKKGKNVNGSPIDEGNKLYDCDGDEISYPIDIEDQFGPPSDDENEQQATESTNADKQFFDATSTDTQPKAEQSQRDQLIELNPLCNHPDLKKNATFVDYLTKFLKTHNTSSKFLPHITAIKKQCLTVRRQVKNRIKFEQEEVHVLSANENQCAAHGERDIETK